jgi:2-amino-4-hydroxy-6-hydroxymethyldihydropteridine diphosphokinase
MAPPRAAGAAVDAYIGLGSNVGDRVAEIERALAEIAALPETTLVARSSLYRTAPVEAGGDDYVNAVARVRTTLAPTALLHALQAIELGHGRQRPFANAPRTLDLDLLLHGDAAVASDALTLPHPRLHHRAFVVVPLAEIAPDLVVPGRGTVAALRAAVQGQRVAKLDRWSTRFLRRFARSSCSRRRMSS